MLIHYAYFNGIEHNIWFYFVNKTGKSIKNISWVVKVSGTEDELELNCDDGYENSDRIYRYIFNTQYTDLDYTGVNVESVTVTFSDGTVLENPQLREEHNLRSQVADAERRKTTAYYTEHTNYSTQELTQFSKEELLEMKKKNKKLGIIFLFLFSPVGIYFLYKASQISKQIDSL